ncbi:MAG: energy transducer TonB [Candidatus Korobacteraceae bacterium]|jgi:protein TonB
MFEDSLLASGGRLAGRTPWTTAVSFAVQTLLGGFLVLLSLIYTETLPSQKVLSVLEAPPPPAAPAQRTIVRSSKPASELNGQVLVPPSEIPPRVAAIHDVTPPGNLLIDPGAGVPNSVSGAASNRTITELLHAAPIPMPTPAAKKVRISTGVAQGLLIRQVKPQYPALARQARIQGIVVLQAVIGKDGTVQNLRVLSGHPMLTEAAIDAVKQWLYKPYYLNGEPVEVDTQINVNFTLSE